MIRIKNSLFLIILIIVFFLPHNVIVSGALVSSNITDFNGNNTGLIIANLSKYENLYPKNLSSNGSISFESGSFKKDENFVNNNNVKKFADGRIIVRFKSAGNNSIKINENIKLAHATTGAKVKKDFSSNGIPGLQVVQLPDGTDIQSRDQGIPVKS